MILIMILVFQNKTLVVRFINMLCLNSVPRISSYRSGFSNVNPLYSNHGPGNSNHKSGPNQLFFTCTNEVANRAKIDTAR